MASISSGTPSGTPDDTPTDTPTPSPGPETVTKFNWLKKSHAARNNPFVKARPTLNRESSSAELFTRENSSADLFQSSRLNLFDTAPKPEIKADSYNKVIFLIFAFCPRYFSISCSRLTLLAREESSSGKLCFYSRRFTMKYTA